jgi:methionine-rich copper-binding protein CopC
MNNVSRIRSIRSLVGGAVIALVLGLSVVTGAPVANAHAEGVASSPVDNTRVASPSQISVTFTENLILEYSYIALFDGAGNPVPQGPATVDASGRVLSSAIPETLAAGIYRVVWNALSVDGHETDGEFSFEVTANPGGDGSATAEPIAEPTEELPVDPDAEALIAVTRAGDMPQDAGAMTAQIIGWSALGAGVVAGIVVAALVFVRRRRVG